MNPRRRPRIEIGVCTGCRWLPRRARLAQELLTTFPEEFEEVALLLGQDLSYFERPASGGPA